MHFMRAQRHSTDIKFQNVTLPTGRNCTTYTYYVVILLFERSVARYVIICEFITYYSVVQTIYTSENAILYNILLYSA